MENLPKENVKLICHVSTGGMIYALGGDREPGEGDTKFIGKERIESRIAELEAELRHAKAQLDYEIDDDDRPVFNQAIDRIAEIEAELRIYHDFIETLEQRNRALVKAWEQEAEFLINNSVGSDISVGNTYKECARQLKQSLKEAE